MSSASETTVRSKRPRGPTSGWEVLSLLLFGLATMMMTVDYVAVETNPLMYVTGHSPWYIESLPLIGVAFVLLAWRTLRRWLGAWVPPLAYILFLYAAMGLVNIVMDQRLEKIHLAGPLDPDEVKQLESVVDEPVLRRSGQPTELVIRRDPQVHERATRWLQGHGK